MSCPAQCAEAFLAYLESEAKAIRFGDPLDPTTDVGTLIDEQAGARVEGMINRVLDGELVSSSTAC